MINCRLRYVPAGHRRCVCPHIETDGDGDDVQREDVGEGEVQRVAI